jgi:hypothetical protein
MNKGYVLFFLVLSCIEANAMEKKDAQDNKKHSGLRHLGEELKKIGTRKRPLSEEGPLSSVQTPLNKKDEFRIFKEQGQESVTTVEELRAIVARNSSPGRRNSHK